MKLSFLNILLLAGFTIIAACKQSEYPNKPEHVNTITEVLYSADSARNDISNFDSICSVLFNGEVPVKAFTVRAVDLFGAMGIPYDSTSCTYHHIRVYLGYNAADKFKLFIVPVEGADLSTGSPAPGTDMMFNKSGRAVPASIDSLATEFVLDLNTPCPSTCDMSSPLM